MYQDNNNNSNNNNNNNGNSINDSNEKKDSNDDDNLNNVLSNMNIDSSSSSKKKKKNTCLYCLKEGEGLQGCSRCGTAHYCGRECQAKHWPVHKNICQDSNDTEDSDEKLFMKATNHSKQGN